MGIKTPFPCFPLLTINFPDACIRIRCPIYNSFYIFLLFAPVIIRRSECELDPIVESLEFHYFVLTGIVKKRNETKISETIFGVSKGLQSIYRILISLFKNIFFSLKKKLVQYLCWYKRCTLWFQKNFEIK